MLSKLSNICWMPKISQGHRSLKQIPSHAVSLRLASLISLLPLGKGFHPGPLYPPAEASWARQGCSCVSQDGTRRQAYLNTYCVPATTVDSTANGAIVTSSKTMQETEPQKNSLFTQDHRVHEGARIRDQGCVIPHLNSPHTYWPPEGWLGLRSESRPLGPAVPLCLSDWLLLQTPSLVFQEGEPIMLRCHSWSSPPLSKRSRSTRMGNPRHFPICAQLLYPTPTSVTAASTTAQRFWEDATLRHSP